MPDSSTIDAALCALLLNDGTLAGLMPDGVYFDEAKPTAQKFIIVSLVDENDEPIFGGRAFENGLYLVKAVALASSGADVRTAAARIDTLLEQGTLSASGYTITGLQRESRVRYTEVDDDDPAIRWQHRGGRYRITAGVV